LLFEPDVDETENPLVLARNIAMFHLEFWGPNSREWESEWPLTNQLPRLVRFSMAAAPPGATRVDAEDVVSRVAVLPAAVIAGGAGGFAPPLQPGGPGTTNRPLPNPALPLPGSASPGNP
jgi:hypothetical protein